MTEEVTTVRIQVAGIFVTISTKVSQGDGQGDRQPTYIVTDDDDLVLGRIWRVDHGEPAHQNWSKGREAVQTWYARREPEHLGPFPDTVSAVRALLVEEGIVL